jgi:hypothetical protein
MQTIIHMQLQAEVAGAVSHAAIHTAGMLKGQEQHRHILRATALHCFK